MQNTYVFIMAGGVGSRFWPKSRTNFPKQFIDILGIGKSLLQLTYERFLKICPVQNIYIITNQQYQNIVSTQLPDIPTDNILCEPSRNNTAPCIAYASFKIFQLNPEANLVVAPSDHFILYEDVFIQKLQQALNFTQHNHALLTLGIAPTRPDTGYGYIKYNKEGANKIHKVIGFTEKPSLEKAQSYVSSGDYVWNAGIFIWKASSILEAFAQHSPGIYALFAKGNNFYNTPQEKAFLNENYPGSPSISVDYAVMEKATNIYTIPADFGWSDLGTWASLHEVSAKDESRNSLSGQHFHIQETEDCIIHLPSNKVGVIKGLQNYIVIDDGDVLLIYPKNQEQEIKTISQNSNLN